MSLSKTILYIEDNIDSIHLMQNIIELTPYNLVYALDVRTALKILDTTSVDLLLVDIMLPKIDGWTLVKHLRGRISFATMPIIMVSAYKDNLNQDEIKQLDCNGFIEKPIVLSKLLDIIERFIDNEESQAN